MKLAQEHSDGVPFRKGQLLVVDESPLHRERPKHSQDRSNELLLLLTQDRSRRPAIPDEEKHFLTSLELKRIPGWEFFAILGMLEVQRYQSDLARLAQDLGISEDRVVQSIRLLRGLSLVAHRDGKLINTYRDVRTRFDIDHPEMNRIYRSLMDHMMTRVPEVDPAQDLFSGDIWSVPEGCFPEVKQKIVELRKSLESQFDAAGKRDRIYCFIVQFFRLSS